MQLNFLNIGYEEQNAEPLQISVKKLHLSNSHLIAADLKGKTRKYRAKLRLSLAFIRVFNFECIAGKIPRWLEN